MANKEKAVLKFGQIVNPLFTKNINKLFSTDLPAVVSYQLSTCMEKIRESEKRARTELDKLLVKYGEAVLDEVDGKVMGYKVSHLQGEQLEKLNAETSDLYAIEVPLDVSIVEVSVAKYPDWKISPEAMESLSNLIKFTP